MTRYRTIVIDPPWDHTDGTGWGYGADVYDPRKRGVGTPRKTAIPYTPMSVAEIIALPVAQLASRDAHLYLWTTQRYLPLSFDVLTEWGFQRSSTLTWCKPITGWNVGGTFASSTEFVHFARRGSLRSSQRIDRQWFTWPRSNQTNGHSSKPDAFLDMVETVSPGPYLELFARRQRLGWDTWGDEALQHVEVGA